MRSHSFMPRNRDLSLRKITLMKYKRLYTTDQYINFISNEQY